MFVAWWTGKGYYTILIVLASLTAFTVARMALQLSDGSWIGGLALIGAAVANWIVGRKVNERGLRKVRSNQLQRRLLYRATHKFMSLPMETFSIVLAIAGVAFLANSFTR